MGPIGEACCEMELQSVSAGYSRRQVRGWAHTNRAFCRQVMTSSGSWSEGMGWLSALPCQVRGVTSGIVAGVCRCCGERLGSTVGCVCILAVLDVYVKPAETHGPLSSPTTCDLICTPQSASLLLPDWSRILTAPATHFPSRASLACAVAPSVSHQSTETLMHPLLLCLRTRS